MNQTALLLNISPVASTGDGIAAGPKAVWGRTPGGAAHETALASAAEANGAFPKVNSPAWDAMNKRRAALIRKDLDVGLTPAEREEYERLQRMSLAAAVKAFPRPKPDFEELARLRGELRGTSAPVTE